RELCICKTTVFRTSGCQTDPVLSEVDPNHLRLREKLRQRYARGSVAAAKVENSLVHELDGIAVRGAQSRDIVGHCLRIAVPADDFTYRSKADYIQKLLNKIEGVSSSARLPRDEHRW